MALAVGDILELKILGTLLNQRVMTVLHYRIASYVSSAPEVTDTGAILDEIIGGTVGATPLASILDCQADNYARNTCTLQKVAPTRSIYIDRGAPGVGTIADSCTLPNVSGVMTKRGAAGGRRGIGGMHFPGLPPSMYTDGSITAAYGVLMIAAQANLLAVLTTTLPAATLVPVIYNPGATPNHQDIAILEIQTTVRTMHRRTVGLGI